MSYSLKVFGLSFMCLFLVACGGPKDKEGKSLKGGEQYLMTKDGLEHVPFPKDKAGNKVEAGKKYMMTRNGLELIPYLTDKAGNRVEPGNEYVMTPDGLKLKLSRNIRGVVQDASGKPLPEVSVSIADTEYKAVTGSSGGFTLPFIEGYVKLVLSIPNLPNWCRLGEAPNTTLTSNKYPDGWDVGAIKLPCIIAGTKDNRKMWATEDGAFVDNGDGTITDVKNKLMWEAQVEGSKISWDKAKEYIANLKLGGYSDWRMPATDELTVLAQSSIACGWHGVSLIRGALSLWSSDQPDADSANVVNVCSGKVRKSSGLDEGASVNPSVLAVRKIGK